MATACRLSSQFQLVLAAAIQPAYPTKRERSYPHNLDYKLPYSEKNCIHKLTIQNKCGRYIYKNYFVWYPVSINGLQRKCSYGSRYGILERSRKEQIDS